MPRGGTRVGRKEAGGREIPRGGGGEANPRFEDGDVKGGRKWDEIVCSQKI